MNNKKLKENVAKNIIMWRKKIGWSQCELSRMSGLTSAAISLIEKGGRLPSLVSLSKMCSAFGCGISEITQDCCFAEEKSVLYAKLGNFNSCSKDDQKLIIELINRLAD